MKEDSFKDCDMDKGWSTILAMTPETAKSFQVVKVFPLKKSNPPNDLIIFFLKR